MKADIECLINPRPDLTEDVDLWARLLVKAYQYDGRKENGLFDALHSFRCAGCRLRMGRTTAIIEPGDMTPDEYAECKAQWLQPHAEKLRELLKGLAQQGQGVAA